MDYDLSRLSSRSFEQMVQALAVRHFGPGVVIFGDGPDGGREATFQGLTQFAPRGEQWDGTCVVQAKFRQRPLGTERDGPWAVSALDEELDKFAKQTGGRQRPDYFIFVTNAVLSPGTDGTKDQATEKLDAAKVAWGLCDYDIWDFDKLRTWLDVDQEVRTRFGWITAGDVLASILQSIQGASPEFEQAIINYLEKTLIADRFVRLEEAGHSAEEPTALSNVFVDLPLVTGEYPGDEGLFLRQLLEHTAVLSGSSDLDERRPQRRIVLIGGPGQGKTTLGQFACQIFRASLLAERPQQCLSPEGREAVEAVRVTCEAAELPFGRGPRFPIRVVLTDLAKALTEQEQPLLAYIAGKISERVGAKVSTDIFRRWLGAYPWFLVLDGLDEVPANAGRERVMRCITDFWVDSAQVGADVIVLATTRPQGYNNDFSPDHHEHVLLAELSAERALDYGSRLAEARYGTDSERTTTVKDRLTRAADDPTTVHLMRSPLQVAIMTALVDRYGQPPHERWSLFNAYYDVIYQRERERDTSAAGILREYRPDVDAIHQHVGLALQVLTTHEGHSDPRLTTSQLEWIIDARLGSEGHEGDGTAAMVAQIRSAAELRLVFLVGAESDRIGFEIRSLQEFMAAGALIDGPDGQMIQRLRAIAPLPAWRNVLLFAAGECFVRRQYLRTELYTLCRELDVDADALLSAAKTGARLALDLLEDRTARRQPKHHRLITVHALDALDLADGGIALRLARCHEDNVDDLYRGALGAAVAGTDEVRRANARRCLIALHSQEVRWAEPMLHDHLPTTAAEANVMLRTMPGAMVQRLDERDVTACLNLLSEQELRVLTPLVLREYLPQRLGGVHKLPRDASVGALNGLNLRIFTIMARRGDSPRVRAGDSTHTSAESPTIMVYRAADQFWADPCRDRLSAVLEDLARQSNSDAWRRCASTVPWPMGILLARAKNAAELLTASKAVRSGAHGDHADWIAAQDEWLHTRSSLIDSLTAEPLAFPIEIAQITITPAWRGGLPWLDDFRALPDVKVEQRAALASRMLQVMGRTGSSPDARIQMSAVIDVIEATEQEARRLEIGILDADQDNPSELGTLLESLRDGVRLVYRRQPDDYAAESPRVDAATLERLERYAIEHQSARSIEALAVALASMDTPQESIAPVPLDETDNVAYASAVFIALITGDRSIAPRELGGRFAAAADNDSWALLGSPRAQSTPDWAEFLVGLHDAIPRTWGRHAYIDRMISEVLSKREAPLVDAETWRALDLPAPHPFSLTEQQLTGSP